jgi:tetratricopeptide (TPR) repeat protein
MFKYLIIFFSFLFVSNDELQIGIDYFNARADNAKGLQANSINVDKAIQIFESQLAQNKNNKIAGGYYMQCLNFKGRFVFIDENEKKKVYNKAIQLGNSLVKQFPTDGKIRFELISSIGLLAEINGVFKSAEAGVLEQMLYHTKILIACDSMYNEGGGWKVDAVLNYKTPNIPLVITWPSKAKAVAIMKKTLKYFPNSVGCNFYYAEALYENNDKRLAKIYFQFAVKLPPRKEYILEDEYFKIKSRKYLEKL